MNKEEIRLKVERWPSHARDQEVDQLRRALVAKEAELEEVKLALLEKEMLLGECQKRIKELETKVTSLRFSIVSHKESQALLRR